MHTTYTSCSLYSGYGPQRHPMIQRRRGAWRRLSTCLGLVAAALLLGTGQVRAEVSTVLQPAWSISPGACELAEASILITQPRDTPLPRKRFFGGKVSFQSPTTGMLKLVCPIIGSDLAAQPLRNMEVLYQDSGTGGGISVNVLALNAENPLIPLNVASVRSNSPTCEGQHAGGSLFDICFTRFSSPHEFDFDRFYYYLEINLVRSDPSVNIGIAGVKINLFDIQ